jgi:hypothetical protein
MTFFFTFFFFSVLRSLSTSGLLPKVKSTAFIACLLSFLAIHFDHHLFKQDIGHSLCSPLFAVQLDLYRAYILYSCSLHLMSDRTANDDGFMAPKRRKRNKIPGIIRPSQNRPSEVVIDQIQTSLADISISYDPYALSSILKWKYALIKGHNP